MSAATETLRSSSPAPRLDAESLLREATGHSRTTLLAFPEQALTEPQLERFVQLTRRRADGTPLAYLLGTREFWSLTLEVTPAVLIPRPETELVVERILQHVPATGMRKVLDLATGSGAIALAVAKERSLADIVATDISKDALLVARRNAERLRLGSVDFRSGSWYEPVRDTRFDLIASNPPYIAVGDPDLEPAVLAHEPRVALLAGPTGLECLEHIIGKAPAHLEKAGWLVVEHGWQQAGPVRILLEQAGFTHVRSLADLAGHERVTEGQWPGGTPIT